MRRFLQAMSCLALAGTIVPPLMFLGGYIPLGQVHSIMLASTILWFVVTPLWMGRPKIEDELVI